MELCLAVCEPAPVGRVDDPDEPVGRLEVVPPVRPQRLLATHVPNVQVETLEREREGQDFGRLINFLGFKGFSQGLSRYRVGKISIKPKMYTDNSGMIFCFRNF